ncbi:MAG: phosphate acyltransferase, partial [Eudoraea sp.]|nr:phosphate acyltransferase [Eudoraea sp.]
MSKAVYIATSEPNSGKSIVTLGVMQVLTGRAARVGYFRPIIDDYPKGKRDNHINTVITHFKLDQAYEESYACTRSEVVQKSSDDKADEILDTIIEKFKAIESKSDYVLVEGTDFSREGTVIEWDFNVLVAQNLGIPAILLATGSGKTAEELTANIYLAFDSFRSKGVEVLMAVANKVKPRDQKRVAGMLKKQLPAEVLIGTIPLNPVLGNPTIKEIAEEMKGKVLFGEQNLHNQAGHFGVGAMQLNNYLTHMKKDMLVITPGDRSDIILGALQANLSRNYPAVSGIILSGGLIPADSVLSLIEGLSEVVPIISVKGETYVVTNKIGSIKPRIYAENTQKINVSIKDFLKHIPEDKLAQLLVTSKTTGITPRMFQYNLLKKAQSDKKHIVLPEGTDERILEAAAELLHDNAVTLTLLGDPERIRTKVDQIDLDLDLNKVNIIDPVNSPHFDDYAQTLYELRKHKNV